MMNYLLKPLLTILALLMTVAYAATLNAQDTINLRGPKQNYFNWGFPDFQPGDTVFPGFATRSDWFGSWADVAIQMDAGDDTLKVYGIAASLGTYKFSEWFDGHSVVDTSDANVFDCLRLYRSTNIGADQIGEDLPVHLDTTPVSFYMNTGFYNPEYPWPVLPVYERYFSSPQSVTGIFYVGLMNPPDVLSDRGQTMYFPLCILGFISEKYPFNTYYYSLYTGQDTYYYKKLHWYKFGFDCAVSDTVEVCSFSPYIFPILTPDPNATGGDTTDVQTADMAQRLTGVMPNPASDKVRVVSSYGMNLVEFFDINGTLILSQRTEGLYADIDISRWPSGNYLVRIHTPMGVATKKLAVQR